MKKITYWFPYIPIFGLIYAMIISRDNKIKLPEKCCLYDSEFHFGASLAVQVVSFTTVGVGAVLLILKITE